MKTYILSRSVIIDRLYYPIGSEIELEDTKAAPLLKKGLITEKAATEPQKTEPEVLGQFDNKKPKKK